MSLVTRRPQRAAGIIAAARIAGQLARRAMSNKRRRTGNPERTQMRADTGPLTAQHDYKTDYRKRRVSSRQKRVRRRRGKFNRKIVNVVRNANIGSSHIIRRSLANLTTATNLSNAVSYGMYGLNGTSTDTFNSTADIREIFREISETDWTNAINGSTSQQHRIYSMHATMEITVRNTGSNDALIECYYIRGKRRSPILTSPTLIYSNGFAKAGIAYDPNQNPTLVNPAPSAATFDAKLAFSDVGVTPFQCPWFVQHYNIYKRQKFTLTAGGEFSFIMHDRRPRTFKMDTASTASTDRSYHGVLFQQFGLPSADGVETYALPTAVTYSSIRRYRLKMFQHNLPKTALDVSLS